MTFNDKKSSDFDTFDRFRQVKHITFKAKVWKMWRNHQADRVTRCGCWKPNRSSLKCKETTRGDVGARGPFVSSLLSFCLANDKSVTKQFQN